MPFITDGTLKQKLADCLARNSVTTTPTWTTSIVGDANADAWANIMTYLGTGGRGLTESQILTWIQGEECQTELGLFFVLMRTGLYKKIAREQIDFYGRWIPDPTAGRLTGLLSTVPLIDEANNLIEPVEGAGRQSYGLMLMSIAEGGNVDYVSYPGKQW